MIETLISYQIFTNQSTTFCFIIRLCDRNQQSPRSTGKPEHRSVCSGHEFPVPGYYSAHSPSRRVHTASDRYSRRDHPGCVQVPSNASNTQYQALILYFDYDLNFYRNVAGKLIHPHGGAGMFSAITEHRHEQIRRAVDHFRLICKIFRAVYEAN